MDQLEELLSQILLGMVKDSAGAGATGMLLPYIKMGVSFGSDMVIKGLIDPKTRYPLRQYGKGKNPQETAYRLWQREAYGDPEHQSDMLKKIEDANFISVMRSRGFEGSDEKILEQKTTGEGFVTNMFLKAIDGGRTSEAIHRASTSIGRRYHVQDIDGPDESTRINASKQFSRDVVTDLNEEFRDRKYGTLNFSDVSTVLEKIVGTGRHDNLQNLDSAKGKLLNEVKGYAKAMETLRSVFDGDVKKLIQKMDALSGGSAMALSDGQLAHTAKIYQHAALVTGVRDANLATLARTMYTQGVAQGGGNERLASNAAVAASYYLTAREITTPDVSQVDLERYYARAAGGIAASGLNHSIATAYNAYLLKNNKENNETSFNEFKKEAEEKGAFDTSSYYKYARELSGDEKTYRVLYASRSTNSLANDAAITQLSTNTTMQREYKDYITARDEVINSVAALSEKQIRDLKSADSFELVDPARLQNKYGLSKKQAIAVSEGVETAVDRLSVGKNDLAYMEAQNRNGRADKLASADISRDLQKVEKYKIASGTDGLYQMIHKYKGDLDLRQMIAALIAGVDLKELEEAERESTAGKGNSKGKDTKKAASKNDTNSKTRAGGKGNKEGDTKVGDTGEPEDKRETGKQEEKKALNTDGKTGDAKKEGSAVDTDMTRLVSLVADILGVIKGYSRGESNSSGTTNTSKYTYVTPVQTFYTTDRDGRLIKVDQRAADEPIEQAVSAGGKPISPQATTVPVGREQEQQNKGEGTHTNPQSKVNKAGDPVLGVGGANKQPAQAKIDLSVVGSSKQVEKSSKQVEQVEKSSKQVEKSSKQVEQVEKNSKQVEKSSKQVEQVEKNSKQVEKSSKQVEQVENSSKQVEQVEKSSKQVEQVEKSSKQVEKSSKQVEKSSKQVEQVEQVENSSKQVEQVEQVEKSSKQVEQVEKSSEQTSVVKQQLYAVNNTYEKIISTLFSESSLKYLRDIQSSGLGTKSNQKYVINTHASARDAAGGDTPSRNIDKNPVEVDRYDGAESQGKVVANKQVTTDRVSSSPTPLSSSAQGTGTSVAQNNERASAHYNTDMMDCLQSLSTIVALLANMADTLNNRYNG